MARWKTVVELGLKLPLVEEGLWMKSPCLRVKTRCFVRVWEDLETLVAYSAPSRPPIPLNPATPIPVSQPPIPAIPAAEQVSRT